MQGKVKEGLRGASVIAGIEILEKGLELSQKLLQELLELVCAKPGLEKFAQVMTLCTAAKHTMDIQAFAKVAGILVSRDAPVVQQRLVLNLALPRGATPVPLLPPELAEPDEVAAAFVDDNPVNNSDDEDEQRKGQERGAAPAEKLEMSMCRAFAELNGVYELDPDMTNRGRPTYRRGGEAEKETLIYFRSSARDSKETGWWVGHGFDQPALLYCAQEAKLPPRTGWQAQHGKGMRQADAAMLQAAGSLRSEGNVSREEDQKALMRVDLSGLLGSVTHRDQDTLEYFSHFCCLMHLEFIAEMSSILRRRRRTPVDILARTGHTLLALPIRSVFGRRDGGRKLLPGWQDNGSEMIAFAMPRGVDMDRFRFARGDGVTLSEQDPSRDRVGEGLITDVKPHNGTLVVQLNGKAPQSREKVWRLDKSANRVIYERQFSALLQLAAQSVLPPICKLLVVAKVGDVDSWVACQKGGGGPLATRARSRSRSRSSSSGKKRPTEAAAIANESPKAYDTSKVDKAYEEVKGLPNLNQSQRDALTSAVSQTCTIIQGPPGTGKTHVSVQVLRLWAQTLGTNPLLAASDSNVAVDNICAGLHAAGVKAVRLGRVEKVRGQLDEITLEAQVQAAKMKADRKKNKGSDSDSDSDNHKDRDPKGKSKFGLDGKGKFGADGKGKGKGKAKGKFSAEGDVDPEMADEARRREYRQNMELQTKILREADVICTTTIAAGGDILKSMNFGGILIDEVAQATELSAIVPIVLRGSNNLKRLALVGDHCQLPPGIASQEAEQRGLSLSIYARLQGAGVRPSFLDVQYRSHPKLAEFSSEAFYDGRLGSGVDPAKRPLPSGVPWPNKNFPVAFVDVGAPEESEGDSKFNSFEAEQVLRLLAQVLQSRELGINDVGIVTPYTAQVRRLRQMARPLIPYGTDPRLMEIASVDAFQGREKELIIFSAVRSNPRGNVGFLGDWRRLNVMLTRARRGLVIFGSAATLRQDPTWQKWLAWCERNGGVHGGLKIASAAGPTLPAVVPPAAQPCVLPALRAPCPWASPVVPSVAALGAIASGGGATSRELMAGSRRQSRSRSRRGKSRSSSSSSSSSAMNISGKSGSRSVSRRRRIAGKAAKRRKKDGRSHDTLDGPPTGISIPPPQTTAFGGPVDLETSSGKRFTIPGPNNGWPASAGSPQASSATPCPFGLKAIETTQRPPPSPFPSKGTSRGAALLLAGVQAQTSQAQMDLLRVHALAKAHAMRNQIALAGAGPPSPLPGGLVGKPGPLAAAPSSRDGLAQAFAPHAALLRAAAAQKARAAADQAG